MLYRLQLWWGMRKLRRMPVAERRRLEYMLHQLVGDLERRLGQ